MPIPSLSIPIKKSVCVILQTPTNDCLVTMKQEEDKPEQSFQPPEVRFSHSGELQGPSSATKKQHGAHMSKTQKLSHEAVYQH